MALNEVGQAAQRAGIRMTLEEARAVAQLVQQGTTPAAAIRQWQVAIGPPLDPAVELAAGLGTPSDAEVAAAIDARWRRGELKSPSAPTAAQQRAAAIARPVAVPDTPASVAVPVTAPAAAETPPAVSRELAGATDTVRRMQQIENTTRLENRWQTLMRAPSDQIAAITASLTPAEASQFLDRLVAAPAGAANVNTPVGQALSRRAERGLVPPVVPPTPVQRVPPARVQRVRAAAAAVADSPQEAAQTVTNRIEHVIDTSGLKSGAAVQARVMETLQRELPGAVDAAGFSDVRYAPQTAKGGGGGVVYVNGEPVARHNKAGALTFTGYATDDAIHSRGKTSLGDLESKTPAAMAREAMDRVATAISDAKGAGRIIVRIPNDGTFTIARNPIAIQRTLLRIQRGGASPWQGLTP
jgi:hypothetical protein